MAEGTGFEPAWRFRPAAFQAVPIGLSGTPPWLRGQDSNLRPPGYGPGKLPTAPPRKGIKLVGDQGFEPRVPEATDLQSAAVANAARHPKLLTPVQTTRAKT